MQSEKEIQKQKQGQREECEQGTGMAAIENQGAEWEYLCHRNQQIV